MRIALIPSSDLSYNSGSVIAAKQTFSALLAAGHDVWMLGSRMPGDMHAEALTRIVLNGEILDHPIVDDRPVSSREILRSAAGTLEFLTNLHDQHPLDVVHSQYFSFTSFAAAAFATVTQVPSIVSSFGRDLSIGFQADSRLKRLASASLQQTSHIIVPNERVGLAITDFLRNESASVPVSVIPQWLDENVLLGEPCEKNALLISTINSCFTPEKGIDDIIFAISDIRNDFPAVRLVIAGTDDHPEKLNLKRIISLVDELGLQNFVTFTGYLDRAGVGGLISRSEVFVDARRTGNFSSVLLEAQFLGAATVCSDTPAAKEIVHDGTNGVYFKTGDWRSLAAALRNVLSNRAVLTHIAQGTVDWVNKTGRQYLKSVGFNSLLEIYSKVKGA